MHESFFVKSAKILNFTNFIHYSSFANVEIFDYLCVVGPAIDVTAICACDGH